MTYEIRELAPDQHPDYIRWVIRVFGHFYGEEEVTDRAKEILNWKQSGRPPGCQMTTWVLYESGKPRGFVGFVPYRIRCGENVFQAAEMTMAGVLPEFQRQGCFQRLLDGVHESIDDQYSVLTSFANDPATAAMRKTGYELVDEFQYLYYPLRGADILQSKEVPKFLSSIGGGLLDACLYGYGGETSDCEINEVDAPGIEERRLITTLSRKSLFVTYPDREEWGWRYAENSLMPGQWYRVRVENQVIGSFVLAEYPGYLSEQPSVYLAENLWAEDEKFRKVMACAFQTARRNWTERSLFVSGTNSHSPFASGFSEMGYKSGGKMKFLIRIPPPSALSEKRKGKLHKPDCWHLFGGDRLL